MGKSLIFGLATPIKLNSCGNLVGERYGKICPKYRKASARTSFHT